MGYMDAYFMIPRIRGLWFTKNVSKFWCNTCSASWRGGLRHAKRAGSTSYSHCTLMPGHWTVHGAVNQTGLLLSRWTIRSPTPRSNNLPKALGPEGGKARKTDFLEMAPTRYCHIQKCLLNAYPVPRPKGPKGNPGPPPLPPLFKKPLG